MTPRTQVDTSSTVTPAAKPARASTKTPAMNSTAIAAEARARTDSRGSSRITGSATPAPAIIT